MAWTQVTQTIEDTVLADMTTAVNAALVVIAALPKVEFQPATGPVTINFIFDGTNYVSQLVYAQNITS